VAAKAWRNDRFVADRLECRVDAAAGQIADGNDGIGLIAGDGVSCAALPPELELRSKAIDGDDGICAHGLRAHDGAQIQHRRPRKPRPMFPQQPAAVFTTAPTPVMMRTPKSTAVLHRQIAIDLHDRLPRHDRELRVTRDARMMVDEPIVRPMKAHRAAQECARAIGGDSGFAQGRTARSAHRASATGREERKDHVIIHAQVAHARARISRTRPHAS
jgi:hypothetical protein